MLDIFFSKSKAGKRIKGHYFTLVNEQSRLICSRTECTSISQRTGYTKYSTYMWTLHASSVNIFKNKIDQYLTRAGHTRNSTWTLGLQANGFVIHCHPRCYLDGDLAKFVFKVMVRQEC